MSITLHTLPIAYRFTADTEIRENGDGIIVISPFYQVTISQISPHLRQVLLKLAQTACSVSCINASILEVHAESELTTFYQYLSSLLRHGMMTICAGHTDTGEPLATLLPISSSFKHAWATVQQDQRYRLSRFAYTRRDEDGSIYLESPLSHARLRLEHPHAASFLYQLGNAVTPLELTASLPSEDATGLLVLLLMGHFASLTTSEGQPLMEQDKASMQWDFHDLLFHSRCRTGRHNQPVGGTYRFLDLIPPLPAVKQYMSPVTIPLVRPDIERLCQTDPGLTAVMEQRASIRKYGEHPITVEQLGAFLYRVARVKEVYHGDETGDYATRPYPDAGASYELELYLTVEQCAGLAPGFYWYNPLEHALSLVHETCKETELLLCDANQSMGGSDRPQVLITLAARFQRVSWKYQSLAYSLILKNVGVLYATMYLVATAMQLAPCALGAGDSDLFAKIAGTEYLEETSVGEFMLGSYPTPETEA